MRPALQEAFVVDKVIDGVHSLVVDIFEEFRAEFAVELIIQKKLLVVEVLEYGGPGHDDKEQREHEQAYGGRVDVPPELYVEDEGSEKPPDQGEVEEGQDLVGKTAREGVVEAGPAQEVVLVNPVVEALSQKDKHAAHRDQVHVEKGKPHHLDDLGVPFADSIGVISRQVVRLRLRHVLLVFVVRSLG